VIPELQQLLRLPARLRDLPTRLARLEDQVRSLQLLCARGVELAHRAAPDLTFREHEFKVASQFGDDGLIRFLVNTVRPEVEKFIEFGVQDYSEANTRYLLESSNWIGLVIDADTAAMENLRREAIYWRHTLTAVGAFITRENINTLFTENGFSGSIGLLSIDIDGNDYWVWEAITAVAPAIIVAEYNSLFGCERAVCVPYNERFHRFDAHHSGQYWGASLAALDHLARSRGYRLVGCNSGGNNAYFIKSGAAPALPTVAVRDAFVPARWRDSRDAAGKLSFLSPSEVLAELSDLPLVDVTTGQSFAMHQL
jgi:hypothetical protein